MTSDRPTHDRLPTTIGFGAPKKAGTSKAHGEPLGEEELPAPRRRSAGTIGPFEMPADILDAWRDRRRPRPPGPRRLGEALRGARSDKRAEFERRLARKRPPALAEAIATLKDKLVADKPTIATRKASEVALDVITVAMPELILGSADLTPSNNTKTKNLVDIAPGCLWRPLHPLRHPRARHGRRHERHGHPRRLPAGRRHLPGLHRLRAPGDAHRGAGAASRWST